MYTLSTTVENPKTLVTTFYQDTSLMHPFIHFLSLFTNFYAITLISTYEHFSVLRHFSSLPITTLPTQPIKPTFDPFFITYCLKHFTTLYITFRTSSLLITFYPLFITLCSTVSFFPFKPHNFTFNS